jgi:hypothetical protein
LEERRRGRKLAFDHQCADGPKGADPIAQHSGTLKTGIGTDCRDHEIAKSFAVEATVTDLLL